MKSKPEVELGGGSSEQSPALEPVLPQPRAVLGQNRTLPRLKFFPVKMTDGCFKRRKYQLELVHWLADSSGVMTLGSCIFKTGYKTLLTTFGNGETIAKMRRGVIPTVCVAVFWNWHSPWGSFLSHATGIIWFSLFFAGACALLFPFSLLGSIS